MSMYFRRGTAVPGAGLRMYPREVSAGSPQEGSAEARQPSRGHGYSGRGSPITLLVGLTAGTQVV